MTVDGNASEKHNLKGCDSLSAVVFFVIFSGRLLKLLCCSDIYLRIMFQHMKWISDGLVFHTSCSYGCHLECVLLWLDRRQCVDSTYNWVQGLGSAPDVPHAVDTSSRKTEGNGVGVTKEPPVSVRAPETTGRGWMNGVEGGSGDGYGAGGMDTVFSLCFNIRLISHEVTWETVFVGTTLFIEIPPDILPVGSKERYYFIILLFDSCIVLLLTLSFAVFWLFFDQGLKSAKTNSTIELCIKTHYNNY